jgi:hypothetical protein
VTLIADFLAGSPPGRGSLAIATVIAAFLIGSAVVK